MGPCVAGLGAPGGGGHRAGAISAGCVAQEHSYLGPGDAPVQASEPLVEGKTYTNFTVVFVRRLITFPGETIPLMLFGEAAEVSRCLI